LPSSCLTVARRRRRGVTTVVIGGIAPPTWAWSRPPAPGHEHGYAVVLAEDAATTFSAEMHAFAFEHIFPHLGRAAKADEIEL
jgi:nicotinamidase-related amidase